MHGIQHSEQAPRYKTFGFLQPSQIFSSSSSSFSCSILKMILNKLFLFLILMPNQTTLKGPRSPVGDGSVESGFHNHPAFYSRTSANVASYGLTPGLPYPFRYLEVRTHPTYTSEEYVNIWPDQTAGIKQNAYREPIIGDFQSMVYDVPFDLKHYETQKQNLAKFGLASLALGILWI
jgi:hypothetical protein